MMNDDDDGTDGSDGGESVVMGMMIVSRDCNEEEEEGHQSILDLDVSSCLTGCDDD